MSTLQIFLLALVVLYTIMTCYAVTANENKYKSVVWAMFAILNYITFAITIIIDKIGGQ